jgi:hypothetical protein
LKPRCVRLAKGLFDFYLFGNVHIALCAVALTFGTQAFFGLHLRRELLAFIFCGTLFGYNLHRLPSAFAGKTVSQSFKRHHWTVKHRVLLATVTGLAGIIFVWSFSRLYLRSQTLALIPAALSLAYAFPIIPTGRKWTELREIPGLKIFVVAFTWACCCGMLPIASAHAPGTPWLAAALAWTIVCAALILALTVPFDIRDLYYDAAHLKTLPAWLGIKRSIGVATVALILSGTIPFVIWRSLHVGTVAQAAGCAIWSFIAWVFVYKSSPERHEYYFSFWIDALLVVLGVTISLFSK